MELKMFTAKKDLIQMINELEKRIEKLENQLCDKTVTPKTPIKDYKKYNDEYIMKKEKQKENQKHFIEKIRIKKYGVSQIVFCKIIGIPISCYAKGLVKNDFYSHNKDILKILNAIYLNDSKFFDKEIQSDINYKEFIEKIEERGKEIVYGNKHYKN